jgi:hypothetical protein
MSVTEAAEFFGAGILLATPTSTAPSRGCGAATPRSSRSRPSSRTAFATTPSAIPRAT